MNGFGDINVLPENCLANVLSLTCPRDACRLSVVASTFRSAAEWDAVWERFLPPEYRSVISQSSDPSLLSRSSSKKELFLSLCRNPILIDGCRKSFWLDKGSGKKCFMLSARDLMIVWGDTPVYWRWTQEPESSANRFGEVAELISVCWFEICGRISACMLSPKTQYAAYLVFKTTTVSYGFDYQAVDVSVGLVGTEGSKQTVYLDTARGQRQQDRTLALRGSFIYRARNWMSVPYAPTRERAEGERDDGQYPRMRDDGWFEIELGKFFNEDGECGELAMSVMEVKGGDWKGGLIVQGIELRPKEADE